ncbi:unnamed protein product [Macrosiphum euphorbiae]|uniref:Uncharacterized protein n=1 Tax=Macrosiphum euphorbiae TaxID=13131 RepID=A0AAV0WFV4_9HEMI|nr:unnamed protein product [Macrosiphum euphorbiae]
MGSVITVTNKRIRKTDYKTQQNNAKDRKTTAKKGRGAPVTLVSTIKPFDYIIKTIIAIKHDLTEMNSLNSGLYNSVELM